MTSKERMLTAMRHGTPDVVPVSPDISNMVPCRLSGKPFWDIYYHNDPPLWRAYADAARFFGMDAWQIHGTLNYHYVGAQWSFENEVIARTDDSFTVRVTCHTPAGDIWQETTYYADNPPVVTSNWIKDLKADLPKIRYTLPHIGGYDAAPLREQMEYVGDSGVVSGCLSLPGIHDSVFWFDGGAEAAVYAEADYPDEFAELIALQSDYYLRMAEMWIDARPDFFMIGASGLFTLQSPDQFRRYSLPVLAKMTRMAKEAGLPSFLHSCGRQRQMLQTLADETDLDVVNPLEVAPMGDCDLAEVRSAFGNRFCLMGNIHTTDVMLFGTPEKVREECVRAIDAAGPGAFILSTGDQCGRDTPYENVRAMVSAAREYRAAVTC